MGSPFCLGLASVIGIGLTFDLVASPAYAGSTLRLSFASGQAIVMPDNVMPLTMIDPVNTRSVGWPGPAVFQ